MKKMTLKDLKELFVPPSPHTKPNRDGLNPNNKATAKHHRHVHHPAAKPSSGKITPAEYRRRHLGRNN
jgi:hypothetical protein